MIVYIVAPYMPGMHTFSAALTHLMEKRNLTTIDVAKATELTQPYISALRSGTRRVGPKSLASLLKRFGDVADQRQLVAAFLTETLAEVQQHRGESGDPLKSGHSFEGLISSAAPARKGSAHSARTSPQWLDELLEEAIQHGESEDEILALIRSLFGAVLQHKRQYQPRKS